MQILRQSTETLERAKYPLQPAVMCSVSGPPAEPASLSANPDESVLTVAPNTSSSSDRPLWIQGLGRHERLQRQASFEQDEKVAKLHIPHPVCPRSSLISLMKTLGQTLVSGLILLTCLTIHLFQTRIADTEHYRQPSHLIFLTFFRNCPGSVFTNALGSTSQDDI